MKFANLPRHSGDCLLYRGQVPSENIAFLVSLVEAHEGLAIVRTKDARAGKVEFWVTPEMREDFDDFVRHTAASLRLGVDAPIITRSFDP